jgi:hypothetical protein
MCGAELHGKEVAPKNLMMNRGRDFFPKRLAGWFCLAVI